MALVCDAEGPSGIAGIMGGQISEVSDKTTRVLMEAATWVGPNILETSKALGPAQRGLDAVREAAAPRQAIAAQRLAARLMVELCGARMVPGTIDAYPEPARAARGGAAARAARAAAGRGDPGGRERAHPRRARLRGRPARRERHGALLARRRRAARGRPDRGGRAHLRPRQAADDAARARAGGRAAHAGAAAAAAARGRAARPRRCTRSSPAASPRPRRSTKLRLGDAAGAHPGQPAERGRQRDAAAAAARPARRRAPQRRARAPASWSLFESAHVYAPGGSLDAPEGSPAGQRPPPSATTSPALLTTARRDLAQRRRRPTSSPPRALVEALFAAAGLELDGRAGAPARSCTRAVRRAVAGAAGARSAGSASCTRSWRANGTSTGAAAFELDFDALAEEAPGPPPTRTCTSFPAVLAGHRRGRGRPE